MWLALAQTAMLLKNVLVLAPHTDDAELGCGGTLARLIEEGSSVSVVAFSTAEASLPAGSKPGRLKAEFLDAMSSYGIPGEQLFVHDFPVRRLSSHRQEVLDELVKLRRIIKPDAVLLPSGADVHQDHQVVHAEGLRAFKEITIWGYELPWNHVTFPAQAFVRLEHRHLDAKWKALQRYTSQIELSRPYFTWEFVESLARVRGIQVKHPYAESFEVVRIAV
jgi:LmbE family N-acetylglucosaminyl deacetylase